MPICCVMTQLRRSKYPCASPHSESITSRKPVAQPLPPALLLLPGHRIKDPRSSQTGTGAMRAEEMGAWAHLQLHEQEARRWAAGSLSTILGCDGDRRACTRSACRTCWFTECFQKAPAFSAHPARCGWCCRCWCWCFYLFIYLLWNCARCIPSVALEPSAGCCVTVPLVFYSRQRLKKRPVQTHTRRSPASLCAAASWQVSSRCSLTLQHFCFYGSRVLLTRGRCVLLPALMKQTHWMFFCFFTLSCRSI